MTNQPAEPRDGADANADQSGEPIQSIWPDSDETLALLAAARDGDASAASMRYLRDIRRLRTMLADPDEEIEHAP